MISECSAYSLTKCLSNTQKTFVGVLSPSVSECSAHSVSLEQHGPSKKMTCVVAALMCGMCQQRVVLGCWGCETMGMIGSGQLIDILVCSHLYENCKYIVCDGGMMNIKLGVTCSTMAWCAINRYTLWHHNRVVLWMCNTMMWICNTVHVAGSTTQVCCGFTTQVCCGFVHNTM